MTQRLGICRKSGGLDLLLGFDDFADPFQKPRIEFGDGLYLIVLETFAHGLSDHAQPIRCLLAQRLDDGGMARRRIARAGDVDLIKAGQTLLHRGKRLLH